MISWISEAEVDWGLIDELQALDPVFSAAVVVEPFPDASLNDVVAEVHRQLAVGYAESRRHRAEGHALWPLLESQISTLIIMGADALATRTVPDLLHLRELDEIDRVLLIGRSDSDVCERFIAAGGRRGPATLIADLVGGQQEPAIEISPLVASYGALDRTLISEVALLWRRVEVTIKAFGRNQLRLAILAAGLQLLDRPRSNAGNVMRLHALDIALHTRGHRLRPDTFADAVQHCGARTQLDLWLPDAIEPPVAHGRMIVEDANLERPLPANDETLARWLEGLDQPRTRALNAHIVQSWLQWRERQQIDAFEHDAADVEDWAFDRLRAGVAPTTAATHRSTARRYHGYLLTGRHDAQIRPSTTDPFWLLRFPDDLADLIAAAPTRHVWINVLSGRKPRAPLESPRARKLLSRFDDDLDAAWQQIEALRMTRESWDKVRPLLRRDARDGSVANSRRTRGYLNAILLVLGTGVPWDAVPPELEYGSGGRACTQLREWMNDETWAAVRSALQDVDVYRDVQWERMSRPQPPDF
jgi:hypothetical protein